MRTFDELSTEEQAQAVNKCLDSLLGTVLEGAVRFNDELNGDNLQEAIDAGIKAADDMQTPWFAAEYVLEGEVTGPLTDTVGTVRDSLEGMARCDAEDAVYPAADERVVRL